VQLGYGAASAASGRPRPTAPAPSPRASRATRISPRACSPPAACRCPKAASSAARRRLGSRRGHRPAGGGQADRRQPCPRRVAGTDFARASRGRLSAWPLAEGSEVMVERFIPGVEHRLLVVGNKLVAANAARTASVVGDGKSTIVQLIDSQINTDPRRGEDDEFPLEPVMQRDRRPLNCSARASPRRCRPRQESADQRNGNLADDVTDEVHPEVAGAATGRARRRPRHRRHRPRRRGHLAPLEEQRGAIVEVNAGPGLLMHLKPARASRARSARPSSTPVPGRRQWPHPHGRHHRQPQARR
jgi:hypothetical protein